MQNIKLLEIRGTKYSCTVINAIGFVHTFARTSYQLSIIRQWRHNDNTIIISCLDHKVGGLINCCVVPDERCRDLKQPTETSAICKSSRRCELDAPETKYIDLASILVGRTNNSGVCQV